MFKTDVFKTDVFKLERFEAIAVAFEALKLCNFPYDFKVAVKFRISSISEPFVSLPFTSNRFSLGPNEHELTQNFMFSKASIVAQRFTPVGQGVHAKMLYDPFQYMLVQFSILLDRRLIFVVHSINLIDVKCVRS